MNAIGLENRGVDGKIETYKRNSDWIKMEPRFAAKNSPTVAKSVVLKCETSLSEEDGKESIICRKCTDPNDDSIPNDPYLPKFMPPTSDNAFRRYPKSPNENRDQLIANRVEIQKLLAQAAPSKSIKKGSRLGRTVKTENPNRSALPHWIQVDETHTLAYQFLIINNDPEHVDQNTLTSIIAALRRNCEENIKVDYGMTAEFQIVQGSVAMKESKYFQGDRIPIFVGRYNQGMFHYANTPEPANTYSFPVGGGGLKDYGIILPEGSRMDYVPYSIISTDSIPDFYSPDSNIYGVSRLSLLNKSKSNPELNLKVDEYYQVLSMGISHEVIEIMGNDTTLNWVLFDHFAPTVAHWHWGEFTDDDNVPQCINGKINKDKGSSNYGYRELPLFLEQFPSGGLIFCVREVGDVVSAGFAGLLNSYVVDGWLMENYPLQSFWKPYNHSISSNSQDVNNGNPKYDKLGYVQRPLEPYGGMHQLAFFISFDDGKTRYIEIQNKGPVTVEMRGAPKSNNFPPDYVYIRQLGLITSGMNVLSMIDSLENYGPSKADRT